MVILQKTSLQQSKTQCYTHVTPNKPFRGTEPIYTGGFILLQHSTSAPRLILSAWSYPQAHADSEHGYPRTHSPVSSSPDRQGCAKSGGSSEHNTRVETCEHPVLHRRGSCNSTAGFSFVTGVEREASLCFIF